MAIIRIKDNENNRWKRNAKTKTKKDRKEQVGSEDIMKE